MGSTRNLILQELIGQQSGQNGQMPAAPAYTPADVQQMRQMMAPTQGDQQSAMGHGLSQMFAGLANPQYRSTLGALAQSGPGAMAAYMDELNRTRALNAQALKMLEERREKAEDRRQRDRETYLKYTEEEKMTPYQRELLALRKGQNEDIIEKKRESGQIPENAVPFSVMPANEINAVTKEMRDAVKHAEEGVRKKHVLAEMVKLSEEYPDMSTDFVRFLADAEPGKPLTLTGFAKMSLADPKKRAAIEKFRKLTSNLVTHEVKSTGGRTSTDIYKKLLKEATPEFGMTPEAIKYMADHSSQEMDSIIEYGKQSSQGLSGRYYVPRSIPADLTQKKPENVSGDINVLSKELNASPDVIKEVMSEMGLE